MKELLAPVTEKSKCVSVFQTHLNQGVKKYHELVAAYPVSLLQTAPHVPFLDNQSSCILDSLRGKRDWAQSVSFTINLWCQ